MRRRAAGPRSVVGKGGSPSGNDPPLAAFLADYGVPAHLRDFVGAVVARAVASSTLSLEEFTRAVGCTLESPSSFLTGNTTVTLPTEAPASWPQAKASSRETPPEFIQRLYAPWLGQGLTRAHIRHLDPALYNALAYYLRGHPMPVDLDLPTVKQQNDRKLKRTAQGGDRDIREARRVLRQLERRATHNKLQKT